MSRGSASLYEKLVRPAVFLLDPEEAHELALKIIPLLRYFSPTLPASQRLETRLAGTTLRNPVGLAAGFDKNGRLVRDLASMGFGFAEIGSITGRPGKGNPRPRLFRLVNERAVINYMGLNGDGAEVVAARLEASKDSWSLPLGINIAKTNDPSVKGDLAVADIMHSFASIAALPLAYAAINVSCPNTHEAKSEVIDELSTLATDIAGINKYSIPLFLKLSPDSDIRMLEEVVQVAGNHGFAGFICGNTTTDRSALETDAALLAKIGPGGLSGRPLRSKALNLVQAVCRLKDPAQQVIACGGIESGEDAFAFLAAGATAVQLYTALVYQGPFLPVSICRRLDEILAEKGLELSALSLAR
ncbi:MAG: quinone-dependent dihydroorotate dehydrogenase [Candidatus Melainabacteria bacterium]|nr:quinone-dependent dihydroorotate dehydrogenase [Candidatus Melainabacteria bacterium]